MKKIIILTTVFMLFGVSQAVCKLEQTENGFMTGAACSIENANANVQKTDKKTEIIKDKADKAKNKKEMNTRMNHKLDRGLLYRNVSILWFNS